MEGSRASGTHTAEQDARTNPAERPTAAGNSPRALPSQSRRRSSLWRKGRLQDPPGPQQRLARAAQVFSRKAPTATEPGLPNSGHTWLQGKPSTQVRPRDSGERLPLPECAGTPEKGACPPPALQIPIRPQTRQRSGRRKIQDVQFFLHRPAKVTR